MEFDFHKLAEETLMLGEELRKEKQEAELIESRNISSGPGIIFRIDCGAGTFCIRGVPSNNLLEDYDSLYEGDEHIVEGLDLQNESAISNIEFFPLDSFDLALQVEANLINKRIPYEEELICNISDPGFCWWMDLSYPGIKIFFHSYSVEHNPNIVKIGPLGDSLKTSQIINSSIEYLSYLMPFSEFSCTEKSIIVNIQEGHDSPCFNQWRNLFLLGSPLELKEFSDLECVELKKFQDFCYEMSAFRSVWKKVEQIIRENRELI